eukprot:s33_g21.t1
MEQLEVDMDLTLLLSFDILLRCLQVRSAFRSDFSFADELHATTGAIAGRRLSDSLRRPGLERKLDSR